MNVDEMKAKSRGVSRDMSPQAISKRFDILVELDDVARILSASNQLVAPAGSSLEIANKDIQRSFPAGVQSSPDLGTCGRRETGIERRKALAGREMDG